MKSLTILLLVLSFNLNAQVNRSPGGVCDLEISLSKIKAGSEKTFTEEIIHQVNILSDDGAGCSAMPDKKYSDAVYKEHLYNEMDLLFVKYPERYSKFCEANFKSLSKAEYSCEMPSVSSISFQSFGCEKKIEDTTNKVQYNAVATVKITIHQRGVRREEKDFAVVLAEQFLRVKECLDQANVEESPRLSKLRDVACKNELTPVVTGRAPAIEKDSSFDGRRILKENDKAEEISGAKVESGNTGK
jgi:hypothetical protein